MITNANITIFNKYIDAETRSEAWQRTQIRSVTWENRLAANVLRAGRIDADSASIYIPKARGADYVLPKAWQALEDKSGKWTLNKDDVIVRGLIEQDIDQDHTMAALRSGTDNVLVITSVDLYDNGSAALHHWKIGAK